MSNIPLSTDPNLLVGTETHDDAGIYRIAPDVALVQTIDFFPPVLDDPYAYGQIAAANALSDVYAMGGTPLTALNLLCYPDNHVGPEWMGEILKGGAERCAKAKCTIVGGHTIRDDEIKFGLSVTGTIHPNRVVTNAGAKPGNVLVLTKPLGTGFVTTAAKREVCPPDLLAAAIASMIELNADACAAMLAAGATAATDVTGYGLAGHTLEMALGSQTTFIIHLNSLPVLAGLEALPVLKFRTRGSKGNEDYAGPMTRFEGTIDPFFREVFFDAQTSGGLLIAVPAENARALVADLQARKTLASHIIGEVVPRMDVDILVKG